MIRTITSRLFLLIFISLLGLGKAFSQASDFGVNLAGLEFGPNALPGTAGADYYVPNGTELDYYKGKGLKLVRLPFLWERIQPTLNGSLDPTYLGYIDNVVALAKARNMSVILDVHNYCRYHNNIIGSGGVTNAHFADLWSRLATHYKSETAVWAYDLMNEPHDMSGFSWFNIAQAAITSIRAVDMAHTILVEGDNWAHSDVWSTYSDNLKNLNDPANRIIYEAHLYFDSNGSGNYSSVSFSGNGANTNTGVAKSTNFINWLVANNKKGFFGEYGIPNNASASDQASWNSLLNNFLSNIKANCIGGTVWAGGPSWGTYKLSVEPSGAVDKPQMSVLQNYTTLALSCTNSLQDINVSVGATDYLTGSTYDFQNVISTGNKPITFTITNKGFQGLSLTGSPMVTVSGTNAAQFAVTTQPASSNLATNATTTFVVTFSPGTVGTKTAMLSIASNDPDENPYTINLTGIGTATATSPILSVKYGSASVSNNGTATDMSSTTVGSVNIKGFILSNTGNNALNISGITPAGTGYSMVAPVPTTVASGSTATVWVKYTSTASTGPFTGSFTIASDDAINPSFKVNLTTTVVNCAGSMAGGIIQDWDNNYTNSSNVDAWNTAWTENQSNPLVNAVNPSYSVAKFIRPATGNYNSVKYKLCGSNTISVTAGKPMISMLIYSPVVGVRVQMNLKTDADVANTSSYPSTATATTNVTKANQWERVYFDFSSAIGVGSITHAEFMVDPLAAQGVATTYYIDDARVDVAPCLADVPVTGILMDYDNHRNMSFPFALADTYSDPVPNPGSAAPNTTPSCMQWIRNAPTGVPSNDNYHLIRYKVCGNNLDLNTSFGSMISIELYSPKAGTQVNMVLQNAATGTPAQIAQATLKTSKANQWETLVFDFTSVKTNTGIKAIDIYIDPFATNAATPAARTYYLDEIKLTNTLPCAANITASRVLNDFDANRNIDLAFAPTGSWTDPTVNPFSSGINTSANVVTYGRVSGTYDAIRFAACNGSLDLSQGKTLLSFMLYSPVAGVPITLSLKDAGNNSLLDVNLSTTTANAWEDLVFDCTSLLYSPNVKNIDIFIDPLFTKGARTYYFDNFRYSSLPKIVLLEGSNTIAKAGTFDMGGVSVGSSNTLTFAIQNSGYNPLTLSGTPKVVVTGSSDFTVDQSSVTSPVSSGAGTLFTITFAPTGSGVKSGAISIANSDASANPFTFNLTGTGLQSVMAISQGATGITNGTGSYSFGSVQTGSSSTAITFTITSSGNDTLRLTSVPVVAISGANSSDFTISQVSTLTKLDPSTGTTKTTTFSITFAPGAAGSRSATVSIANNDPAHNPYTFSVSGTGTTTPTPLHSGTALAGVSIVAYPNPFSEEMSLSITAPSTVPMFVKVLDMKGQVVMESEAYTTNQLITLGKDFPAGLYLIEAVLNGELKTMKISKQ